jgi:hypothetical protein
MLLGIDDQLARSAGELAEEHELRGYDAAHLQARSRLAPTRRLLAGMKISSAPRHRAGAGSRLWTYPPPTRSSCPVPMPLRSSVPPLPDTRLGRGRTVMRL